MKIEDAIRQLKYVKKFEDDCLYISDLTIDACDMAISALEKQIPKEATTQGMSNDGYWIIKCPECETVMEGMRNVANYCCKCGQAIK